MRLNIRTFSALLLGVCGLGLAFAGEREDDEDQRKAVFGLNPTGLGAAPVAGSTGSITPPIAYRGGPVLDTPTVYIIWYGNWNQGNGSDTPASQQLVRDFFYGLSDSGYFRINTSYGTPTGSIFFGGETTDTGSQGTRLTDSTVGTVVSRALSTGALPVDAKGVYFVLTSSNVSQSSGFCTKYCGYHTYGTFAGGTPIKFSFVGNARKCLSACGVQSIGPNGDAGIDATLSVLAHELEEAVTDPQPSSGWVDSARSENADKCAYTFGQNLQRTSTGAYYNQTFPTPDGSTRNYLIQRNLDANSQCYVDYDTGQQ